MIAIGAAFSENRSTKLVRETKVVGLVRPKYSSSATVTTRIVASRWRPKTPSLWRSMSTVPLPVPTGPSGKPASMPPCSVILLTSASLSGLSGQFAQERAGSGRSAVFLGRASRLGLYQVLVDQVLVVAGGFAIAPDGRARYFRAVVEPWYRLSRLYSL